MDILIGQLVTANGALQCSSAFAGHTGRGQLSSPAPGCREQEGWRAPALEQRFNICQVDRHDLFSPDS